MTTLGLADTNTIAVLLLVFGVLMAFCALMSRIANRTGVPIVLIFLVLGMLGGSEGIGGIEFTNADVAFRIATTALVLILFDGGVNTSWESIRRSAAPAGILATVGVIGTGFLLALMGRMLGLGWGSAALIGAIVSSTDAAAVFAVLRGGGVRLQDRVGSILEVESCVNDPMAIILTVTAIDVIASGGAPGWSILFFVPLQLVLGALAGVGIGLVVRIILKRIPVGTVGLYPVVMLAAAFVAFGVGTLIGGSGILAVFVAGVVLGNGPLPYKAGLRRVIDAFGWLSQVTMFLMLGLLVFPSTLLTVLWPGLALGLFLAFVARPVVVAVCLIPLRLPFKEILYIGWIGLRGAVPIILGLYPILAELPGANEVFHIVFFIVVVSALVPGASILPVTRWLGLGERRPPPPRAALELHALKSMDRDLRLYILDENVAAAGARLAELPFPEGVAVVLVVRGDEPLAARGNTVLQPGDYVYVVCRPEDEAQVGLFLGSSTSQ